MIPTHTFSSWVREFQLLPWQLRDGEESAPLFSLYNDVSTIMDGYFTQDAHIDWYGPVRVMQVVDVFTQFSVPVKKAAVANAVAMVRNNDYRLVRTGKNTVASVAPGDCIHLGERFCLALAYSGDIPHETIEYVMRVIDGQYSKVLAVSDDELIQYHLIRQRDADRAVGFNVAQFVKDGTLSKHVSNPPY